MTGTDPQNDSAKPMPQGQSLGDGLGGRTAADVIGTDVKISKDGAVTGTLKYVESFPEFSPGNEELCKGHYFPVVLDSKYTGKDITVTGNLTKKAQDLNWVLHVKSTASTFKFHTDDDGDFLTLSFEKATLQEAGKVKSSAHRKVTTVKK